jgi:hypothetical protein
MCCPRLKESLQRENISTEDPIAGEIEIILCRQRIGNGKSVYSGVTNGSFSPPSLVFKYLQSDAWPSSRTQCLSFGSHCAPPNGSGLAHVGPNGQ